jgi:hypothetical protein
MPDLGTPEKTREFLALCLDPAARRPRTPAKLARIMPDWLRTALHGHAPHLATLHDEANRLEADAAHARTAYVKAMKAWTEGND